MSDYAILIPYNGTISTGGDSLTDDLNHFYTVSSKHRKIVEIGLTAIIVWRYRVDMHVDCIGAPHDTGCWVSSCLVCADHWFPLKDSLLSLFSAVVVCRG